MMLNMYRCVCEKMWTKTTDTLPDTCPVCKTITMPYTSMGESNKNEPKLPEVIYL